MAWISFGALPWRKKIDDNSSLDVAEIALVAWRASFQSLTKKKTCNSAHEQTPLSKNTIDSVLRHRRVGRAKDLWAPPYVITTLGLLNTTLNFYQCYLIFGLLQVKFLVCILTNLRFPLLNIFCYLIRVIKWIWSKSDGRTWTIRLGTGTSCGLLWIR